MRRTTPDLVGQRKTIYSAVSIGLLALSVLYVLWTNYVVFVGGNLPLTSISLGEGSTGAGLTMLFIGDLIAIMLLWFLVDGTLLNLLHMALRAGKPKSRPAVPTQAAPGQAQPQWQPQPNQPGQPTQGPQGWQPQPNQPGQQQWQPQGQQQPWQPGQPQGQPQQGQSWQNPGQQQWQPPSSPPSTPPSGHGSGSAQATLVRPGEPGWPQGPGAANR
jgi:hypothetical protein